MKYITRIIDKKIDIRSKAFGAINIIGPKGSGKTRTAKERCKTIIEFQDEEKRDGYMAIVSTSPKLFLKNPNPILFDEWQDAPKLWGNVFVIRFRNGTMIILMRMVLIFSLVLPV